MSYNDRAEAWAEKHSKNLKILYVIWSVALVVSVVGFASGFFEDITFDADKVPVGFMDEKSEIVIEVEELEGFELIGIPEIPIAGDETAWDCELTEQFGTVEECNEYWDDLTDYARENGRVAMLQKLNDDGHLSDVMKVLIYDLEGVSLP